MIRFNIAPVPASRARVTRWATFFPKKYQTFRDDFKQLLQHHEKDIHTGNLFVRLDFHVQMAKSWSNKKKEENNKQYCDNNADIDNYIKAALDSLESHYYENDKQIVMIRARKFWAKEGYIKFDVENIE